jgi:hypothetical protein
LVHRQLWKYLIAIAISREPWQMRGLSSAASFLLEKCDQEGAFATSDLDWPSRLKSKKPGDVVRDLETRLLIHTEEFHTESGAHAKLLESWEHWRKRIGYREKLSQVPAAKRICEELVSDLNTTHGAKARLPWQGK